MTSLINNPWIPLFFHLVMGFTGTSLVAMGNYWLFHQKRGFLQDFLTLLTLFEWGGMLLIGGGQRLLGPRGAALVVIILSSIVQAFIEKAIDKHRLTFKPHFLRSLITRLCLINVAWVILVAGISPQTPSWVQGVGIGVIVAFFLAPISISAVRWMLLTSKLQPGVDRLFQPDETPEDEGR